MLGELIPIVANPKNKTVVSHNHQKKNLQKEEKWMFFNDSSEVFLIPAVQLKLHFQSWCPHCGQRNAEVELVLLGELGM